MLKKISIVILLSYFFFIVSCDEHDKGKKREVIFYYPGLDKYPVAPLNILDRTFNLPLLPSRPIFYNAGILPYQNKYLVASRTETFFGGVRNTGFSRITLAFLKKDFSAYGSTQDLIIKYNGKIIDVEDPRLFVFRGDIYICFNMEIRSVAKGQRQIYFAKIDLSHGLPKKIDYKRISYNCFRTEKNWTPFEYKGELYFISDHSNQQVFKVDDKTGKAIKQSVQKEVSWPYGEVRGGSPTVILNKDEFLTFFHSSKIYRLANGDRKKIYFAGALTFSRKPPFEILRMTKNPIMDSSFYDDANQNQIIFPTGILLEGKRLSMLSGKNDNHLILSQMSLANLEKNLISIH